ncbi:MAG: hypothetical protein NVS4B11_34420 [Ktedonobacteraceae bacterium]
MQRAVFVERRGMHGSRLGFAALNYGFYILLALAIAGFFYYLYSYRDYLLLDLPVLLQGAGLTIVLSIISMVLATIFGLIGALGRLSRFAPIRWIAFVYVEVIRGSPILVQLLLWGFGVSTALATLGFDPYNIAYQIATALQSNSLLPDPQPFDAAFYGIIGLSFNYGAYLTEVFRAGIETVDKGQGEAALSLGLNSQQTMRHIILPQAIRITIPPFTNYFITLVQDTALLSVIGGVIELQQTTTALASTQSSNPGRQLFVYIFGALIFLLICYPLALLSGFLERRLARAD